MLATTLIVFLNSLINFAPSDIDKFSLISSVTNYSIHLEKKNIFGTIKSNKSLRKLRHIEQNHHQKG